MLTKPFSGQGRGRLARMLQSDLWWSLRQDYVCLLYTSDAADE